MSAYIVDPRTIDYLIAWAHQHRTHDSAPSVSIPERMDPTTLPDTLDGYGQGERFSLMQLTPNDLGAILLAENVRSVQARYPREAVATLPGPCDQSRVLAYQYQPVPSLNAAWVVKSCDCLDYQSCETDDWRDTLAYAIVQTIRESAISALTEDAPWGVTDEDLTRGPLALVRP